MKRILVIDDEHNILLMLKKMLEKEGYEVDLALNGKDGLDLLNRISFDLVITDIIMPEMEGLETIASLRKKFPDLKIIAISGGGRVSAESYLNSAKLLGAATIIQKPFERTELVGAVHALLD